MTPRDKAIVGGLIAAALVLSIPLMFLGSEKPGPRGSAEATSDPSAAAGAADSAARDSPAPHEAVVAAMASGPPSQRPAPAPPVAPLGLGSPRETVETQRRLLESHDDETFRSTFLPPAQRALTPAAVDACRQRLVGKTLKPDWEVAEESVETGDADTTARPHKVVRVSIFGKSMTGFHEVAPGRWLADAAWCVPVW